MNIITILGTALITSILWVAYIKFFYKKDKDHEIQLLKTQNDSDINLLKEKINSIEKIKTNIEESLTQERLTSK